jgi:hypothetical protein
MKQKTYGVNGKMEWLPMIKIGNRKMQIPFLHGITSGSGRIPASFTTKNPIIQFGIEQSVYFKEGVIHIEKVLDITDHKAKVSAPVTQKSADKVATTDQAGSSDTDEKDADAKSTSESTDGNIVEVESIADAKDYLVEKFGYKAGDLQDKKQIENAAKNENIVFMGL